MENTENENGLTYEMGDSAMTIEYLRARLLSERSVSKSAKQRADELAELVVELEEQLKVVYLQRKKTQKATLDVLAILGSLGISEDSEERNMSSDQESTHPQACNGNCLEKNTDKSRSMDQNGFEPTTYSCRSLSWNSSRCSSHCESKFTTSRRRSSYLSSDFSSPKHHAGKPCRQIKCKEMRSTADELSESEAKSESQIAGGGEMERALERRAELVNRFEAEENAQIEWEEKYKELNSCTPDSVEPGSQSDVTEERDELRSQPAIFQHVNEDASAQVKDARTDEVCRILSNEDNVQRQPSPQTTVLPQKSENRDSGTCSRRSHTSYPDDTVPMNETEKTQDKLKGYISSSSEKPATNVNYCKGETSKEAIRKSVCVSLEASKDLGKVLEELQRAKLTLQQRLRKLPEDGFIVKARDTHHVPIRAPMPASCAGLFWVPTDPQTQESFGKSYLDSRSPSSLMDHNHASISPASLTDNFKLKSQEGITMLDASNGISFDFSNNTKTALSSLWNGDDYTRSPSVFSERGFSNSDRYKLSPQFGTPRSSFTGSDRYAQSPLPDFHFGFLTNNSDGSRSPLANNRSSPSSSERREFKPQPETTLSSPVHNDQFARNAYSNSSSSQILFNTSLGSSQRFSAEPYNNRGPDISPSSNHRLMYSPTQQSICDINKPATPTFRSFPSLPSSPGPARDLTSRKLGT